MESKRKGGTRKLSELHFSNIQQLGQQAFLPFGHDVAGLLRQARMPPCAASANQSIKRAYM
ncbi:hypothetical protein G4G28_20075 [Massilia sp. Dwa41.01b]|uniref:hypothetical protein n=1 Tax=unclassified Massilia TaxID=2609279 RepID=UPI001602CEC1|nr:MULTISPECIES: hypothetical protein [unclassified Massilia]QNA90224.1 hypothetical protein G4G28_20075 [Massilia sp. Dwa41.01b]QNB01111.1 hypothetical protein G4G31_23675 [Massilia sp. Se16.2.3]